MKYNKTQLQKQAQEQEKTNADLSPLKICDDETEVMIEDKQTAFQSGFTQETLKQVRI